MTRSTFRVADYAAGKLPPVCIAHRGFSGRYPENTRVAFEKAVEIGAHMVEFDIRWSADRHLVVFHDADLARIAGRNVAVQELTLKELQQVDVGVGQRILRFEQVLDEFAGRIGMNLHVQATGELVDRVVERCRQADLLDQVFLAITWAEEIQRVRAAYPDVWVCSLYEQGSPQMVEKNAELDVKLLQPSLYVITEDFVQQAKSAGMVSGVFYANTFSTFRWFKQLGIEGILTDHPDVFFDVMGR